MFILGQTEGFAGNFNGDSSDDLMRPDGTTIAINSTLRDIHYEFGEKCKCYWPTTYLSKNSTCLFFSYI